MDLPRPQPQPAPAEAVDVAPVMLMIEEHMLEALVETLTD
jgi:hypothetical protein